MKIKFKIIFFLILLFSLFVWVKNSQAVDINFTKNFGSSWAFIDKPNNYDYEPSAMVDNDGTWKVWTCGGEIINGEGGDSVYLNAFDTAGQYIPSLNNISVLRHSTRDTDEDGMHACNPSVIKASYPSIENGREMYKMYYECAEKAYNNQTGLHQGGFLEICHAVSDDGVNWRKFNADYWQLYGTYGNSDTPPTPVIKISDSLKQNCNWSFHDGKYWIDSSNPSMGKYCSDGIYGVGHPYAIYMNTPSGRQVWLYYYDSGASPGSEAMYLAKSWDGFNFYPPEKTNLYFPPHIKYLEIPIGNNPGVFIGLYANGLGAVGPANYFAYSFDGLNWIFPNDAAHAIGMAMSNLCVAPGASDIVTDKYGIFYSPIVNIFSNEGLMGMWDGVKPGDSCYSPQEDYGRGSTWAIHLIQGQFSWITSDTTSPVAPQGLSVQ
ncbi:MAG: hypothetical protein UW72_C0003G0013 [Parcubacteria group bacterium GW2011_GWF2_44_7]|nr:MAG: hypothetical protein UW72_C0003G0013 [Parcubacteria group bacterium GW2011_GWF2_44_7]